MTKLSALLTFIFIFCISNYAWAQPGNDNCANAISLSIEPTCISGVNSLTGQTFTGATVEGTITSTCAGINNSPDVWYKFVAQNAMPTITINNKGTSWGTSMRVQILDGSCGSFTSVACSNIANTNPASFTLGTSLIAGKTYYIRIHRNNAAVQTSGNWGFDICITGAKQSRMNEVFKQTVIDNGTINKPWEITYGPDGFLWITGSQDYKVYRMDPNTPGIKTTVLDVSQGSTFFSAPDNAFHAQFNLSTHSPQGGLAGLVLHPKFLDATAPQNYAYVSYVHSYDSTSVLNSGCKYFKNRIVRFTYNTGTNKFESPVSLCDTLTGGNDHNSQRMIIAPVDGVDYLFYASGDVGGGQLACAARAQKAQLLNSYEGKILRFNLVPDTDPGPSLLNKWIPNDNPFNDTLGVQSAVWVTGIRNNQGFAYDSTLKILYGSSHGPYSDDEINIIERGRNYGHPLVIGYASDNNYNGASAGTPKNGPSTISVIINEASNAETIGASYKDPLFSAYAGPTSGLTSVKNIWTNTPAPGNSIWPSEGWSGLDIYNNSKIPGWKNSLLAAGMKWGRVLRLKLDSTGKSVIKTNGADTIAYWQGPNGYRDIAFGPNGKDIYVSIDRISASGPGGIAPPASVTACDKCIIKYTFLGYSAASGNRSTIPTSIDIAPGKAGVFEAANKVVINAANGNNNLWVPITDTSSNIIAEINAQGQNLDTVTTVLYTRTGPSRIRSSKKYLNRNLTITPQKQPVKSVLIRLYISKAEFDAYVGDGGVGSIGALKIIKNEDSATTAIASNTTQVNTSIAEDFGTNNGYVLQGHISSFSSFYFAADPITLPLQLLNFKGALQNNAAFLQWETANETNTSHFVVERSIDGNNFGNIGTVAAAGNSRGAQKYDYTDNGAALQPSSTLYYRLKMVDLNGDFTYSKVITITLKPSGYTVALYPNPIHDVLKVRLTLSKAEPVQIEVTDMNGRIIYKESRFAATGTSELKINSRAWPSQLYSVRVTGTGNNTLITQNVIKL